MCGIGGFSFTSKTSFGKDILLEILNKIKQRGPDDKGTYEDKRTAQTSPKTSRAIY